MTDNSVDVDPNSVIQVRSSHESGQELPIGRTAIRVTATDQAGNVASCDFDVEVKGNEWCAKQGCIADCQNISRVTPHFCNMQYNA